MHLRSVHGFRGAHKIDVRLDPVTVVCGTNESGKTTLIELIMYGILGLTRERRPSEHDVTLDWGDFRIDRRVERPPEQDAIHSVAASRRGFPAITKSRDAALAIAAEVGGAWNWDVQGVLASTAPERRKALSKVLGSQLTVTTVREALAEDDAGVRAMPPEARTYVTSLVAAALKLPEDAGGEFAFAWLAALREAKNKIQADVEAARAAVATAEGRVAAAGAMPGALDAWEARVTELRDRAASLQADLAAAAAHATDREALEGALLDAETARDVCAITARTAPDLELLQHANLGAEQAETAAVVKTFAATEARARREEAIAAERTAQAHLQLARQLVEAETALAKEQARAAIELHPEHVENAREAHTAARAASEAARAARDDAALALDRAREAYHAAEAARTALEQRQGLAGAANRLRELLTPVVAFEKYGEWPFGNAEEDKVAIAERDAFEAARAQLLALLTWGDDAQRDELKAADADVRAGIAGQVAAGAAYETARSRAVEAVDASLLAKGGMLAAISDMERAIALREEATNAIAFLLDERNAALAALVAVQPALEYATTPTERLESMELQLRAAAAQVDAATRQETRLREAQAEAESTLNTRKLVQERAKTTYDAAVDAQVKAMGELAAFEATAEAARARVTAIGGDSARAVRAQREAVLVELAEAEAILGQIRDYAAITADRDRCVEKAGTYSVIRNTMHEVEKRAEAVVARLYTEAVRPLVEPASEITRAVLGRPLTILPADGWSIGIDGVPVEHCSQSVALICGIALHAAVQRGLPGWKAVLVDNAEVIEKPRRSDLVRALAAFGLDTVLLASGDDGWQGIASVKVINFTRSKP